MATIEILKITRSTADANRPIAFVIDAPKKAAKIEGCALPLDGWVLSATAPVSHLEIKCTGMPVQTTGLNIVRRDVAAAHPEATALDGKCGFATSVGVLGLAPECEIAVEACLGDGTRARLAGVRLRHTPLRTGFEPKLRPLMVTSIIGRTGRTWLMHLLASHPEIVAERTYPYETLAANYWMHMLKILSEPANHEHSSHPVKFLSDLWLIGRNPFFARPLLASTPVPRRPVQHWLGQTYVENLALFCQQSTEGYYSSVAEGQGKQQPSFFAEKYHPWHIPRMTWELYPQAREIFLVRDLRDVLCSVIAFNAKRGVSSFGRDRAQTDDDYIRQMRHEMGHLLTSWKERSERGHLVHYEDLIRHPHETLAAILEYLDLDRSPALINGILDEAANSMAELRDHQTSANPTDSVGRWQRDLSPALQESFAEICGDLMKGFGY